MWSPARTSRPKRRSDRRIQPGPNPVTWSEFRDTIIAVEIHSSARKHGISDEDIQHALEHAVVVAESDEDIDKVLYLGPDRAGNLLEVITALRADESEIVIHAMRMRAMYESLLRDLGEIDG